MDYKKNPETGSLIPVFLHSEMLVIKAAFQERLFSGEGKVDSNAINFFKQFGHTMPSEIEDFYSDWEIIAELEEFDRNTEDALEEIRNNRNTPSYKRNPGDLIDRQEMGKAALKLADQMKAKSEDEENAQAAVEAASSSEKLNELFDIEYDPQLHGRPKEN